MRTLKKTLALVLVVAMMLSFGAIGANAAFTDTKDSKYTEAIEVMTGIGVINGMTDTTFAPTATLTREQAAKIITYMLLGPTNAQLISKATTQKFSDVAADRWSAGYIEYCANVGIILGTGNGKFDPEGKLTTAAFTKMLLCALGYKSDVEGFAGDSWAINVAAMAVTAGVSDKTITISATTEITREQACQLAFLALKAVKVQYTGGSSMTVNGITITTGATRSNVTHKDAASGEMVNSTFMYVHFSKLATEAATENGVVGYYWKNGTKYISSFYAAVATLATSTNGTSYADLTTATSTKYIKAKADTTVTYVYNDVDAADKGTANTGWPTTTKTLAENIADIQAKAATVGVIVKFLDGDFDGKYDVVSVVEKSVAQLAAAPTTKTTGSVTTVTIPGVCVDYNVNYVSYPDGLVKGDVVLYYNAGGAYIVEKAASISGTVASYVSGKTVTIGGTAYAASGLFDYKGTSASNIAYLASLIGLTGYTFYLDNGNNICFVVTPSNAATATNTVLVYAVQASTSFGVTTNQAKIVKMDGTTETITVAKVGSTVGDPAVPGTYYIPTLNANGTYTLTAAAQQLNGKTTAGTAVAVGNESYKITAKAAKFLTKGVATNTSWTGATETVQDVLATNSTVFLYYNTTAGTFTVLTGINNALSTAYGKDVYVLKDSTGTYALAVVSMGATTSASVTSSDVVFVTSGASVSLDANGVALYSYTVVKNGVSGTALTSYAQLDAGTLYFCTSYDASGNLKVGGASEATASGALKYSGLADLTYAYGTLSIDAGTDNVVLTSDSTIYFMYDLSAGTVSAITADAAAAYTYAAGTDFLYTVVTSSTNSTIGSVYITVA